MPKVETHVLSADDKEQPFALHVPNAETRAAMAEADEIARAHRARFATADELFDDLEKSAASNVRSEEDAGS